MFYWLTVHVPETRPQPEGPYCTWYKIGRRVSCWEDDNHVTSSGNDYLSDSNAPSGTQLLHCRYVLKAGDKRQFSTVTTEVPCPNKWQMPAGTVHYTTVVDNSRQSYAV